MYRLSSDGYFENSIDEEYVVRKRRGKKKGKGNMNLKTNQVPTTEDSDANMEELENDDEKSINDVQPLKIVNNNFDYQNADEDMSDCLSRVSVDGVMKAPPQIQIIEPEPYDKNKVYSPSISQEEPEIIQYNIRALSKHAVTYELEKFEKNCLIIFNQENVDGFKPRHGTEKDVQALKSTFRNYGFEVKEHKDFTKDEVFRELMTCTYCVVYFSDWQLLFMLRITWPLQPCYLAFMIYGIFKKWSVCLSVPPCLLKEISGNAGPILTGYSGRAASEIVIV